LSRHFPHHPGQPPIIPVPSPAKVASFTDPSTHFVLWIKPDGSVFSFPGHIKNKSLPTRQKPLSASFSTRYHLLIQRFSKHL
jgi:hypothetical protein